MGLPILSLAVAAGALLGSLVATYLYDHRTPLLWRIPIAMCTGLAALGLTGFLLALQVGITPGAVAMAGAVASSPVALLAFHRYRRLFADDLTTSARALPRAVVSTGPGAIAFAIFILLGVALLWRVADRVMFVQDDGVYTGVSHNIGDLPFHLTITNRFVYGENVPPEHPSFAGVTFTYPFLTDFIGGMFVRTGVPIRDVIVWSTFFLCLALGAILYRWTLELTGNLNTARIAVPLAFLSGGLGWWRLVGEAQASEPGVWALLANLPHDYTITFDNEFRWGNLVTTLLVTQRGLLLGLPLALIVFRLLWQTVKESDGAADARRARMIAAGVVTGMLPLVHSHSFVVVVGVACCLAAVSADRRTWAPFFIAALLLGLPQIWSVTRGSGIQAGAFLAWSFGWDRGDQNVFAFWIRNTGAFIPLVLAAFFWRGEPALVSRTLRWYYLPFALCFIVPNLVQLAPWIWDNVKVLVYWFVASVPLVALALSRMMQGGPWRRALAVALFLSLTLAGALDLWRVASGAFESRVFGRDGIDFAGVVTANTAPGSLILHDPTYNHPVALTGRRSLMGYPGHVWSHGLNPGPREADIRRMYAGGAEGTALLTRYAIDYVVIGPAERDRLTADEVYFERYPQVGAAGGYRLFRITR